MLHRINHYVVKRRLRSLYERNFSFIALTSATLLLVFGLWVVTYSLALASAIALVLLLIMFGYYFQYFRRYRILEDIYSEEDDYHFEIFEFKSIFLFSSFFLFSFAFIGTVIGSYSIETGLRGLTFYELLSFLAQKITDSLTLGFLDSYDLLWSRTHVDNFWGSSYIYFSTLAIELAVLASLIETLVDSIKAKSGVEKAIRLGKFDASYKKTSSPRKVREILKYVNSQRLDINKYATDILDIVARSSSKEARNLMLQLYQESHNASVIKSCEQYFSENHDRRFNRVKNRHMRQNNL